MATRLHELTGQQLGEDAEDAEVVTGIHTDRGPWVAALVAAGYVVYAVNPPHWGPSPAWAPRCAGAASLAASSSPAYRKTAEPSALTVTR